MGAPEHAIEGYLMRQCAKRDILCLKFESPGKNGYPDRILIAQGKVVFVEVKRPGEKPRQLQQYRLRELTSHGVQATFVDTREAVDDLLNSTWPA